MGGGGGERGLLVELHRPRCDRCSPSHASSSACSGDGVLAVLREQGVLGVCGGRWRRRGGGGGVVDVPVVCVALWRSSRLGGWVEGGLGFVGVTGSWLKGFRWFLKGFT